jgi:large subunit ribosomal protein L31
MKENTHPAYHKLKLRVGNESFETMSTYSGGEMLMDVDFRQHPAWTKKGVASASQTNQNISAFNSRFSGLTFGAKASS